uniref:Uncharacterized protein n=1 Tax=Mola mola TaxID=94237 RepID=A0A3Q3X5I8_MOLML
MVRVDERATIEDVANHWWVNWGFEESVCDCPSSPHQECPSPLQPSSKMPKKGILKNLCEGESGCGSSTERSNSGAGLKESDTDDLCSHKQHSCLAAVENPSMRAEAVRRRKGILKRNGKFSHSLDLPDDHYSSPSPAPAIFPEVLQQLVQAAEGRRSRPSSMVSEDSLFSSDSFDLLDLSAQSRRKIFSRRTQHSACSSEEDLALADLTRMTEQEASDICLYRKHFKTSI